MARFKVAVPLFVVLSLLLSGTSLAQVPDTGQPFFGATRSDADPTSFIDLHNLNIHTTIPVYSKAGLMPFSASFVRDNNVFSRFPTPGRPGLYSWTFNLQESFLQATPSG